MIALLQSAFVPKAPMNYMTAFESNSACVPSRGPTIFWNKEDIIHWRMYAPSSRNESMFNVETLRGGGVEWQADLS